MANTSQTERLPPEASLVVLLKAAMQKLDQGDVEAARLLLVDLMAKLERRRPTG